MIAYGPTSIIVQVTDSVNASATQSLSIPAIYASWDINLDESVNVLDLILVAQDFGQTGTPGWIREDVNDSGEINILDLIAISQHFTS
jgi:hypothetical protein